MTRTTVVSSRGQRDITVIDIAGRLTLGPPLVDLREALSAALAAGTARVVINLSETEYLDSAGVGELIACVKMAQAGQCSLTLANVPKRIGDLLKLAGAWSLFQIAEVA